MPDLEAHFTQLLKAITTGRLVAFLGAGANLCSRAAGVSWQPGQHEILPHGGELAGYLSSTTPRTAAPAASPTSWRGRSTTRTCGWAS